MTMRTVRHTLNLPGRYIPGSQEVAIRLCVAGFTDDAVQILQRFHVKTSAATGTFYITLDPNTAINPDGTWYVATLPDDTELAFIVPDSVPVDGVAFDLYGLLVEDPADPGSIVLPGVSYTADQGLTSTQRNQALRNIGAASIIEPEQFNLGSDQLNLQALINYGASSSSVVYGKLRSTTYTIGTASDPTAGLTYDGTHGNLYLDCRGAQIIYQGTGALWSSSIHTGGNNPPRLTTVGGYWEGLTAAYGFYGLDNRAFNHIEPDVYFPVGAAFAQVNQDVYCERNNYERARDLGSKYLLYCDVADFKSTTIPVTFTASNNRVTFQSTHSSVVGDRVKFTGITGGGGLVNGTTYYVETKVSSTVMTLAATSGGAQIDITTDGTGSGWIAPASSQARTRVFEARLTGGTATFCKIKINRAGCYDSHFSGRGNIPDGVGVFDMLGAGSLGNTDLDFRCEAVTNLAGGAFLIRWGQAGGFPPSLAPAVAVDRLNVFDPLASTPDGTASVFGNHQFHGIASQSLRQNSYLDLYGRTSRTTLAVPVNPTGYVTDGTGTGTPEGAFGHFVLTAASGKHLYVDTSGGTGSAVYQQLDTLLNNTLTSSTFVRTGAYSAVVGEVVRAKPTTANTITLPTAPQDGSRILVKNLSTTGGVTTVACGGSDVFDQTAGSTTLTLTAQNSAVYLQYMATGAIWLVLVKDPGSVSVVAGQLIGLTTYKQNSAQTQATTPAAFNVLSDMSGAAVTASWTGAAANMFDCVFVCPASGLVDYEVQANLSVASGTTIAVRLAPYDVTNAAAVSNSTAVVCSGTGSIRATYKQQFSLTPGTTYTWRPQWCTSNAANAGQLNAGGPQGTVRVAAYASM